MARRSVAAITREVQKLAAEVRTRRAEVRSDDGDRQRIARARVDVLAFGQYVFGERNFAFHREIQRA